MWLYIVVGQVIDYDIDKKYSMCKYHLFTPNPEFKQLHSK